MSYKERQIVHENGDFWVLDSGKSYVVMCAGITHSVSDSAYTHNVDGLSIAAARCDYLARTRPEGVRRYR